MDPDPDEHTHPGEEDLEWGQGVKEKQRVDKPQSKYWAVGEQARKMLPRESLCKIFCGGRNCKYCTSDNWGKEQMAVHGLYSQWVTCNILAMARLSNENIKKFDMIKQFQNLQVKTVINLQQPGEHAHCGFGNDDSGFSYNPQTLNDAGLFYYNFTIQDYGVTGMSTLLDIVKVMQFAVSLGKVAVHCHAGLGRTGLIIACYLIYNNRVKTYKAIQYVRSRRPGAIQTKQQMTAVQQFEEYLQPFFIIFSKIYAVSFNQFLARQRHLLHGYEARKLKHIPKVVYVCCERLLELCGKGNALSSLRNTPEPSDLESLSGSLTGRDLFPCDQLSLEDAGLCSTGILRDGDVHEQKFLGQPSLVQSDAFNTFGDGRNVSSLFGDTSRSSESGGLGDTNDDSDDCIVYGQTAHEYKQTQKLKETFARKAEEVHADGKSVYSAGRPLEVLSSDNVWSLILKMSYPNSVLQKLSDLKESLNSTEKAWQDLAREDDLLVLSGIMCDWLDQLNEPVLRAQDMSALLENFVDPGRALLHLGKSTKYFLEYIILVISKFDISSENLRHSVLEFFLLYLCQKKLNLGCLQASHSHNHFGELKQEQSSQLFTLFLSLLKKETDKLNCD